MSSPKHVIRVEQVGATTPSCHAATCKCGWKGSVYAPEFHFGARMDGIEHAIEVAASVLPEAMRPVFLKDE